jgi:hypothetical protein
VDCCYSELYLLPVDCCYSEFYLLPVDCFFSELYLLPVDCCYSELYLLLVSPYICQNASNFSHGILVSKYKNITILFFLLFYNRI